jgi:phage tail tape-measure protein
MSTIIAGHLETQPQAQQAIGELQRAGFSPERIATFFVNPPGQHDAYPIGGDFQKSPGAEDTGKGAAAGVAAGAAAGLVGAPVVGPLGPLVGGYVGGLVGGLSQTKDSDDDTPANAPPHEHRSGLMVAVAADDESLRSRAIDLLRAMGAYDIEMAEGTIRDGDWVDFNPVASPRLVELGPAPERKG